MIEENHITEKRKELIWALSLQDYSFAQIGRIFNIHRSTVLRIVEKMPKNYKPKWVKI
jgi:IS30 family transposase